MKDLMPFIILVVVILAVVFYNIAMRKALYSKDTEKWERGFIITRICIFNYGAFIILLLTLLIIL